LRPKRDQILYAHEGPWDQVASRIWLVNLDGKQKQSLRPRQGEEELGHEYWTGDGKLVGYVHYPDHSGRKATVRALNPDTREDQLVSPCTQFWDLMGNADNSVIAGASRSKAGPNIYVLFAVTQRETTVCEHAFSGKAYGTEEEDLELAQPRPAFSPDSQWIYFTSDREGTPAVYRAPVADLVEKTG
jgi:oligogalacturonide lyase